MLPHNQGLGWLRDLDVTGGNMDGKPCSRIERLIFETGTELIALCGGIDRIVVRGQEGVELVDCQRRLPGPRHARATLDALIVDVGVERTRASRMGRRLYHAAAGDVVVVVADPGLGHRETRPGIADGERGKPDLVIVGDIHAHGEPDLVHVAGALYLA